MPRPARRRVAKGGSPAPTRDILAVISQRQHQGLQNARRRRRDTVNTMISESSTPQPDSEPDDRMPEIIQPSQLISNGMYSVYAPIASSSYYRCFQLSLPYSRVARCLSTVASVQLSYVLRATFTRILYCCVSILQCSALDGRTISSKL